MVSDLGTALLTGMRSGEIQALVWSDIDLDSRRITVSKSFDCRMKTVKSTKAGYWHTVPISDELFQLLSELKSDDWKSKRSSAPILGVGQG